MYEDQSYSHREEKLAIAKEQGYDNITEAIVDLYRKGKSSSAIARIFNVKGNTILTRLKKVNEPIRPRGGKNRDSKLLKRAAELGDTSNMTVRELMKELGCGHSWLYIYGKEHGVKFKSV